MAKHPTPKRQLPKSDGRKRYGMFQYKARKRLENAVNLVDCSNCKGKRMSHHACPSCGYYRGRKVIDMSSKVKEKIQKISA
ncbi:MAG: 50S ribosomal protein L32 [bacterium]|nr:50S ribosomal protein L32 [bacterium]